MIISKENRRTIYETLFKEGVLVAPKNFEIKHPELDINNLEVVKAMQSLTSKGFVHTQFSWQWYFYTLTNEVSIDDGVGKIKGGWRLRGKEGRKKKEDPQVDF